MQPSTKNQMRLCEYREGKAQNYLRPEDID
jgi:hypothetical protein